MAAGAAANRRHFFKMEGKEPEIRGLPVDPASAWRPGRVPENTGQMGSKSLTH
jgi:hypothetical protein